MPIEVNEHRSHTVASFYRFWHLVFLMKYDDFLATPMLVFISFGESFWLVLHSTFGAVGFQKVSPKCYNTSMRKLALDTIGS